MAVSWPTAVPYMTGDRTHLQLEMLIGWDQISHAFQQLLNVNNIDGRPKLKYAEFHADESDYDPTEPEQEHGPAMPQPMYHKAVLHEFSASDEETCKFL